MRGEEGRQRRKGRGQGEGRCREKHGDTGGMEGYEVRGEIGRGGEAGERETHKRQKVRVSEKKVREGAEVCGVGVTQVLYDH